LYQVHYERGAEIFRLTRTGANVYEGQFLEFDTYTPGGMPNRWVSSRIVVDADVARESYTSRYTMPCVNGC
jgi:hypothetical protein